MSSIQLRTDSLEAPLVSEGGSLMTLMSYESFTPRARAGMSALIACAS